MLRLAFRGAQERRVFGQLLITVPCEQAVQPRGKITPLVGVEIEISIGAPAENDVRLRIADAQGTAAGNENGKQGKENDQVAAHVLVFWKRSLKQFGTADERG